MERQRPVLLASFFSPTSPVSQLQSEGDTIVVTGFVKCTSYVPSVSAYCLYKHLLSLPRIQVSDLPIHCRPFGTPPVIDRYVFICPSIKSMRFLHLPCTSCLADRCMHLFRLQIKYSQSRNVQIDLGYLLRKAKVQFDHGGKCQWDHHATVR